MAEGNGRSPFGNINLSTVVQIVTIIALFAGNWYVMGDRIENNAAAARDLRTQMITLDARLDGIERDLARLGVQFENIREAVTELRRQSSLRAAPRTTP